MVVVLTLLGPAQALLAFWKRSHWANLAFIPPWGLLLRPAAFLHLLSVLLVEITRIFDLLHDGLS